MVEAPHPLKYIRRFVVLQEDILAARQPRPDTAIGPRHDAALDPPIRNDPHTANPRSAALAPGPARPN
jgi:hypothetical protein